jgi:hypothetical protein
MSPASYDWPQLYAGAGYGPIDFQFQNSDETYKDLTGFTAVCQAKKDPESSVAIDFGPSVFDVANGIVRVLLNAATTDTIDPGDYQVDFILIDPIAGPLYPSFQGSIRVVRAISEAV